MQNIKTRISALALAGVVGCSGVVINASESGMTATTTHRDSVDSKNNIPITLNVLNHGNPPLRKFSVAVPTSLPVVMDLSGAIVTANNAEVRNKSTEAVRIRDVQLSANSGWTLKPYGDDILSEKAGTKSIGFQINNCNSTAEGFSFAQESFPTINVESAMPVVYDAKIPRQEVAGSVGTIGNSVFIIGWDDGDLVSTTMSKSKMDTLCKNLNGTLSFLPIEYTGEITGNAHDISADGNGTVVCVVDGNNAMIYSDGGILAPADASSLFFDYRASIIDVSGLDTRKTKSMSNLFYRTTNAHTIKGLNNFDMSHVSNISNMFDNSRVSTIDISSWDFSKHTPSMSRAFTTMNYCTIYCKSDTEAKLFKNSSESKVNKTIIGSPDIQ